MILYCHNDGPAADFVITLSDFLRICGVDCDIDQYHANDNITDWDQWWEQKINEVTQNGFVLFAVAHNDLMKKCMANSERIQMSHGFISGMLLSSILGDIKMSSRIIPVFLDNFVNGALLPGVLSQRTRYCANIRVLETAANGPEDLDTPGLESLKSLVFRLTGQIEVEKPMVAPVPLNSRELLFVNWCKLLFCWWIVVGLVNLIHSLAWPHCFLFFCVGVGGKGSDYPSIQIPCDRITRNW